MPLDAPQGLAGEAASSAERSRPLCILVTGGPGAGKTRGIEDVRKDLLANGINVLTVPEAATIVLVGSRIDWQALETCGPQEALHGVQRAITTLQIQLRKVILQLANDYPRGRTVVLFDRGELDGEAYNEPAYFRKLLTSLGMSVLQVWGSYDAVIHMRTVARSDPALYSGIRSTNRREDLQAAIALDERIQCAWSGHPDRRFVDASPSWDQKRSQLIEEVHDVLRSRGVDTPYASRQ